MLLYFTTGVPIHLNQLVLVLTQIKPGSGKIEVTSAEAPRMQFGIRGFLFYFICNTKDPLPDEAGLSTETHI